MEKYTILDGQELESAKEHFSFIQREIDDLVRLGFVVMGFKPVVYVNNAGHFVGLQSVNNVFVPRRQKSGNWSLYMAGTTYGDYIDSNDTELFEQWLEDSHLNDSQKPKCFSRPSEKAMNLWAGYLVHHTLLAQRFNAWLKEQREAKKADLRARLESHGFEPWDVLEPHNQWVKSCKGIRLKITITPEGHIGRDLSFTYTNIYDLPEFQF